MSDLDLYTEPEGDPDTLVNLGPLRPMAGIWAGSVGEDVHPSATGPDHDVFVERYELQPIDRQTNGPQLFYGLRYHTHIVKPGEVETFHDQVGYWLWEPETELVTFSLTIPRGQALLASGPAAPGATEFTLRAERGSEIYGIVSNPFLDTHFRTVSFSMTVTIHPDGTWSYTEDTMLKITGEEELFAHRDTHTLTRVAPPSPNPLAAEATR